MSSFLWLTNISYERRINNRSAAFLISTLDVQDPHIKGIDFPIQ